MFGYISRRQPVIIDGLLPDDGFNPADWTVAALGAAAGGATVDVERRDDTTRTFGTGHKEPMLFRDFLSRLTTAGGKDGASGTGCTEGDSWYLTTQRLPEDEAGLPTSLFGAPLTHLPPGTFPLRPALMGNLIPSTINLWMGRAAHGSSSNLHHDFHDNLYLLLSGRKRFTIAPPTMARRMYLHGNLACVHPNGLIAYAGCVPGEDGALPAAVLDYLTRTKAPAAAIAAAEKAVHDAAIDEGATTDNDGDEDAGWQGGEAEAEGEVDDMWTAMEAGGAAKRPRQAGKTPVATGGTAAKSSSGGASLVDEMWAALERGRGDAPSTLGAGAALCARGAGANDDVDDGSSVDGSESEAGNRVPSHFSRISMPALRLEVMASTTSAATAAGGGVGGKRPRPAPTPLDGAGFPPLSSWPTATQLQSTATVRSCFPRFVGVSMCSFDLLPGQMLYLPASWFHEVVSCGEAGGAAPVHTALNYWFYPPTSTATQASPYPNAFWADHYASITTGKQEGGAAVAPGAASTRKATASTRHASAKSSGR